MTAQDAAIEDDPKEVIIFLDVDGVLNDKWIGHVSSSIKEEETPHTLHPRLIDNLCRVLRLLEIECDLEPVIVLSTTWRLRKASRDELLSRFAKQEMGKNKTLVDYVNKFDDGEDDSVGSWATPDLGHGTSPEGRAAEIEAWLGDRSRTSGRKRSDMLFLILDDLDLLYTEAGKRNDSVCERNFVCTASYRGHRQVEGEVGLTEERVESALDKVKRQSDLRKMRRCGTGQWTEAEWALISANTTLQPHLEALRSDSCPSWILEVAQGYIKEQLRKVDGGKSNRRFWRWRRRRRG